MGKKKAAKEIDKLAKKISKQVPDKAKKFTSEKIIHMIRYGVAGN